MSDPSQKPRIFIGSSTESGDLASSLKTLLENGGQVSATHWQDAFSFGQFTLSQLEDLVPEFDFAAFLIAPDDVIISRHRKYSGVRDNVLLEAGMFLSALGRERCYIIFPSDFSVKLPSDIFGMTVPTWSAHEREDPEAALRNASHRLLRDMLKKGRRASAAAQFFRTRDEAEVMFRSFRERIAEAEHELVITGNDCLTVVQGGEPSIRKALEAKPNLKVKVLCAAPQALGLVDMITRVDPRFPRPQDFENSIATLLALVKPYEDRFGQRFELRLLPVLPSLGFFLVDPDQGGSVKVVIYTPQPWEPIDSRPHFSADDDPRWRNYFVQTFRNYWNMGVAPADWELLG